MKVGDRVQILCKPETFMPEYPEVGTVGILTEISTTVWLYRFWVDTGVRNLGSKDGFWHYMDAELELANPNQWDELLELL